MTSPDDLLHRWVGRETPGAAHVHFDRARVLHERYVGLADVAKQRPVDADTSFHGFSVTKTMTALAVLQLAQAGRLDLDAPVKDLLPSFPYPGAIRIRHLLTHTAGLPNPLPLSWIHAPDDHGHFDRDAFFAGVFAEHPTVRWEPGDRFSYSNLGYVLLGQVIEHVTCQRYEEVIARSVFAPAGIRSDELGFHHPATGRHATGYLRTPSLLSLALPFLFDTKRHLGERIGRWRPFHPFLLNGAAYGGSIGTATGYRRYLQALLNDGLLLDPAQRQRLLTEARTNNGRPTGMAMSWFTGALNGTSYVSHAGGGGGYYAELRLYPALGRSSVALFNRTGVKDDRLLDRLDAALLPG